MTITRDKSTWICRHGSATIFCSTLDELVALISRLEWMQ